MEFEQPLRNLQEQQLSLLWDDCPYLQFLSKSCQLKQSNGLSLQDSTQVCVVQSGRGFNHINMYMRGEDLTFGGSLFCCSSKEKDVGLIKQI